jgi:hypothetical protein
MVQEEITDIPIIGTIILIVRFQLLTAASMKMSLLGYSAI